MSYKYRFILAFVTLEIFFITLIVGVNFVTIDKNSQNYIEQRLDSTQTLISELIKAPMSVYDLATLDNIVHNIKKIQNIQYVVIVDSHNRVLSTNVKQKDLEVYNNINTRIRKEQEGKTLVFDYKDIYNDGILLGHIHLVFDITDTLDTISKNREKTFAIIVLQIFISTILAYFIGRQLTLKLNNLSEIASQIAKEQDTNVPYKEYKDEIGYLATSMQQMQDEIIKRNQQLSLFAKVFQSTQEAIVITNKRGDITHVNEAFSKITGYSNEEAIGLSINILKSGNHTEEFYARMWEDITSKGTWNGEIINKRRDGSIYIALLNISTLYEEGEIVNYVGVSTDITEIKEKEKLMQLQTKMATMGEMLSNIAHQWRQPLSSITSAASSVLVQKDIGVLDDESLVEALKGVIKSSEYLSKTIDDFRNYFKQEKRVHTFSLNEMLNNDLTIIQAMLKSNYIKLILDVQGEIHISTYHNELIQVLMNIIHNSKDAMNSKKVQEKLLFIQAKVINDEVQLCVRDNGGGIKEEIIEHIFEPYFTTKHQSQGTGIGLYMSHNMVVEHMKGRVEVKNSTYEYDNKMHQGLDFYIYLPLSFKKA